VGIRVFLEDEDDDENEEEEERFGEGMVVWRSSRGRILDFVRRLL
jgi:hypothetical protein